MTGPLPANWATGQQFTAAAEDAVEAAVNTLYTFSTKTANYSMVSTDHFIAADATSGAITMTLPTAVGIAGWHYIIEKIDSTSNVVTVATTSSQTIAGQSSQLLVAQYQRIAVVSNGANWLVMFSNYAGLELGYAQTTTTATTTNTTDSNAALSANTIPGLSITTVGTGRPVRIEWTGQAYNTVTPYFNAAVLLTNGSTANGALCVSSSPAATIFYRSMYFQCRQVLTAGTSYTFQVGMWAQSGGGTATFYADSTTPAPMTLSVVGQ